MAVENLECVWWGCQGNQRFQRFQNRTRVEMDGVSQSVSRGVVHTYFALRVSSQSIYYNLKI